MNKEEQENEIINNIYDTLAGNTRNKQFNPDEVDCLELDNSNNSITFKIGDITYQLKANAIHASK